MPLLAPALLRLRSPQAAPAVLSLALAGGLGGLALPAAAGAPAPVLASASAFTEHSAAAARLVASPERAVPVVAQKARAVRATRTRARAAAPAWVRPVSAGVNSPYGQRWGRLHKGLDFAAHYGAPIHAIGNGVVIGTGFLPSEGGYGRIILVSHGHGIVTAYAHTSKVLVHAGQRVRTGQVIGRVGATGHVTGPHLHFEVRVNGVQVNPRPWLRRHGIRV